MMFVQFLFKCNKLKMKFILLFILSSCPLIFASSAVQSIISNIKSNILEIPEPGWVKIKINPYLNIDAKHHNVFNKTEGFSHSLNFKIPEYNFDYEYMQSLTKIGSNYKFEIEQNYNCAFLECESFKSSNIFLIDISKMALKVVFNDKFQYLNGSMVTADADFNWEISEIKSGRNTAMTFKESGDVKYLMDTEIETTISLLDKYLGFNRIANWAKEYTISWNHRCGQNLFIFSNGCNAQLEISGIWNENNLDENRIIVKATNRNFYTALDVARRRIAALKIDYNESKFYSIYLAFERSRVWKHLVTVPGYDSFDEIVEVWKNCLKPFKGLKKSIVQRQLT